MGLETINGAPPSSPNTAVVNIEGAPAVDAPKKEDFLSPRFAALARKEKAIRAAQSNLQKEQERVKTLEQTHIPKDRLKTNLLEVLQEQGIGIDQISQLAMNQPGPQDQMILELKKEIESLKKNQVESSQKQQEAQSDQYKKALETIHTQVKDLVSKDDTYEVTRAMGQDQAVVDLIEAQFKATGIVMNNEEAAKKVEETLLSELSKYVNVGKVRALFEKKEEAVLAPQKVATTTPVTVREKQLTPNPTKTLTNASTAAPSRALTEKDRRARAIAILNGLSPS